MHQLQALGMDAVRALEMVNRLIDRQAAMLAADELFRLSAWLFVLLIPIVWLARPGRSHGAAEVTAAH